MTNKNWTYKECKEIASRFSTQKEFRLDCPSAYRTASEKGWLKDYDWFISAQKIKKKHVRKPAGYWSDYNHCKEEAAKYSSIGEFQKKCSAGATQARKKGWLYEFYDYKSKPKGYWNNYERCKEIASYCNTRSEFAKRNSAAYMWSRKNGWIELFDWLIDKRIFNDSKVDCVYAYEFIKYNSVYVGRTLMRRKDKRDYEHRNGYYKDDKGTNHLFQDSLLAFSIENNCEIPPMTVLEENLTIAEGREREDYWKNYYNDGGWFIINKAQTGINSGSLGALDRGKWTRDTCKIMALGCNSLSEFKLTNGAAYEASRINDWLKDYTWFADTSELLSARLKEYRNKDRKWTYDKCYELALSCKTSSELRGKSSRAYAASKEYGWFKDYTWFVSGFSLIKPVKWTEDACKEIAKDCKTKTEFKKKNSSAYDSARKNGWLADYDWFIKGNMVACEQRRKYTYERCYEIASSYQTAAEFKAANSSAYKAARVGGWIKDYIWFVNGKKKDRKWSNNNLKLEASKYIHERDFMLGSNVAYRKARDNNRLNDLFSNMRFNFDGYYEESEFELKINSDIQLMDYKYLLFSSTEAQKKVFNFFKEEMQQGQGINVPNLGRRFIELTGFYDLFPKRPSWEKFKLEVCPFVLYSFKKKKDIVLLTPHNMNENSKILIDERERILEL